MLLDEWKVTPNAIVSLPTAVKCQLPNQCPQGHQSACYSCGEINHLSQDTVLKIAKRIPSYPRSGEITIVFPSPTAKRTATNASKAENTSAKSTINGAAHRVALLLMKQQLVVLSTHLEEFESQCQEKYSSSNPVGSNTKSIPKLHDHHLQLLLISHHYLLLCLDYLPLPRLNLQRSQKLSYISITFYRLLLHLQRLPFAIG